MFENMIQDWFAGNDNYNDFIRALLQDTVEAALRQIEEKSYVTGLIRKGVTGDHIRRYGFAFCGKEVLIAGGYFPKSTGSTGDSGSGGMPGI